MATVLTEKVVQAAAPGIIWDASPKAPKGFMLRTYGGGTKSFCLSYRNGTGIERRVTIGNHPVWSVEAARERARELRREIDCGADPREQKRERRTLPTVQDLADRYISEVLPTLGANSTEKRRQYRASDTKKVLDAVVKQLGRHTAVSAIHFGDVQALHRAMTESRGPCRCRSGPRRCGTLCSRCGPLSNSNGRRLGFRTFAKTCRPVPT